METAVRHCGPHPPQLTGADPRPDPGAHPGPASGAGGGAGCGTDAERRAGAPLPALGRAPARVLGLLLVLALSVAAGTLSPAETGEAVLWPAAGVATLVLLGTGRRGLPALVTAVAVVVAAASLLSDRPLGVALGLGLAHGTGALVFRLVWAGRRCAPPVLHGRSDLLRLVAAAVLAAGVAGALVGLSAELVPGAGGAELGGDVAAAQAAAAVLVVPVLLAPRAAAATHRPRCAEVIALTLGVLLAFGLVFAPGQRLPIAFVPLLLVVWTATRLSPRQAALEALAAGVVVSVLTTLGAGPFAATESPAGGAPITDMLVPTYLVVLGVLSLSLSVGTFERDVARGRTEEERRLLAVGFEESTIGLALIRWDRRGASLVEMNQAASGLLGGLIPNVRGEPVAVPDTPALTGLAAGIVTDLEQGRPGSSVREVQLDTAARPWVQLAVSWVPDGPRRGLISVQVVDLTAQRETQELVRTLMQATTTSAIVAVDPQGVVRVVNAGAELMLGLRADDLVGVRRLDSLLDADQVARRAAAWGVPAATVLIHDPAGGTRPPVRDWTLVLDDGTSLVVSLTVSTMHGPGGDVTGWVGIAQDVTERRQAEQSLTTALAAEREAVSGLAEVSRIKSELVASVSHELRTPITSVLGFAELLQDEVTGGLSADQAHAVDRIQANSRRLLRLIEDLLTVSAVEAGRLFVRRAWVDVGRLVESAVLAVRESVSSDLTWSIDLGELDAAETRGAGAWLDPTQVERVLINLVGNAARYSRPGGQVRVTVRRTAGEVELEVADDGIGIDVGDQERVFERFYRGSAAHRAQVPGTGLGLSIVRAIAEAHGGRAALSSTPGRGTTVTVTLPCLPTSTDRPGGAPSGHAPSEVLGAP